MLSLPDFPIKVDTFDTQEWRILVSIYRGNASVVYKIEHVEFPLHFAVLKKYSKIHLADRALRRRKVAFENEVECLKLLNYSEYTSPLWFYYETATEFGLIMEYMNHSTLRMFIYTFEDNFSIINNIVYPLLCGIRNIHATNIIHRDLKPENIFMNNSNVFIGDYGSSFIIKNSCKAHGIIGTLQYMSPELLEAYLYCDMDIEYSTEVDIWSLGIIIYELYFHIKPFNWDTYKKLKISEFHHIKNVLNEEIVFPHEIHKDAKNFIEQCLQKQPVDRPTIIQLLNHSWVINYLRDKSDMNEKCHPTTRTPQKSNLIQNLKPRAMTNMHLLMGAKRRFWKTQCTLS